MLAELRQTTCVSPVIFMTVFGSERIAVEAFRLGVRDYLNKPFTVDEVRLSVDRALSEKRLMREREELNKNLLTAEAVRVTVITLSHYLNNSTMVLNNVLTLLEEKLDDKYPDPNFLKLVQDGQDSVKYIQAVMQVLQQATSVKLTPYTRTTPMIDIEAALKENLSQLSKKKK